MPLIIRKYESREVGILVRGYFPHSFESERAIEGDIIAIRRPGLGLGMATMSNYLWLVIEGLDRELMDRYKDNDEEPLDETGSFFEARDGGVRYKQYDKRRFCIPLQRLKLVAPWLDLNRVRDINDIYQPFVMLDEETGHYVSEGRKPLSLHGLVYDKAKQRFL